MPSTPSHYQLLGLPPEASAQQLRQAFRSLSKLYHPDTTSLPAADAREAFARLRLAYGVLADPDSRRAYDAQLQRQRLGTPLTIDPPPPPQRRSATAIGVRRSLSGGEWFALLLLALALVLSLILGVGLAWARGAALIIRPSWWVDPAAPPQAMPLPAYAAEGSAAERLSAAPALVGEVVPAAPRTGGSPALRIDDPQPF